MKTVSEAQKSKMKAYYEAHKEKIKKQRKEYYEANKKKISDRKKAYYKSHKENTRIQMRAYREANKEKISTLNKAWRIANKEYIKKYYKEYGKKYFQNNKERIVAHRKDKMDSDPLFKLSVLLRQRLNKALKHNYKSGSAVRDLGCSVEYLKAFLEGQFEHGMSWENYGEWHIDHIRPLASFDLTDPEQFKQAVHYTNLQPLWAKDNLSKGSKT